MEIVRATHPPRNVDKTFTPSATLAVVLTAREGSDSGAYFVYDLRTGRVVARHQLVRAVLEDSARATINKLINDLDGGQLTMKIDEPTKEAYEEIENTLRIWEEEVLEEDRKMKLDRRRAEVSGNQEEAAGETLMPIVSDRADDSMH